MQYSKFCELWSEMVMRYIQALGTAMEQEVTLRGQHICVRILILHCLIG